MKWYDGPTLIEALDGVTLKGKEKPLRFAVQDIYKVAEEETIVGRVESGILRRADNVIFEPSGVNAKVEKINVFEGELAEAKVGDSIGIIINGGVVKRGDVLGLVEKPPKPTNEFLGEAVLLDKNLKKGEVVEIRCGTAKVSGEIKEIRERIDSETGAVLESNPEEITEHDAATIVFATDPLVVEEFAEIPELGRFVLVKNSKNIGAGVVLSATLSF
jgi:elongation factor 1-alpha